MGRKDNGKSSEAQKNAAKRYAEKVDHISVVAPKGTKDKLRDVGEENIGAYINGLVEKDLRGRHREVMRAARERIQRDIKTCHSVVDWHKAFHNLLGDFKDEVIGEHDFEEYIAGELGREAVEKFCKNMTVPAFGEDVIKHMEAVDDFFESREDCAWLDEKSASDNVKDLVHFLNTPEACAMEDYKYLAHLYSTALLRSEQLEAAITDMLGEEAFDRLVAQGSYDTDKLYYAAMASTRDRNRQARYFMDWMAGRGIFAPDGPQSGVADDMAKAGWKKPSEPPSENAGVLVLLADGASRPCLYISGDEKRQTSWLVAGHDYSRLVIGWKPMEDKKGSGDADDMDIRVRRAYMNVLHNMPGQGRPRSADKVPNWRRKVSEYVEEKVSRQILACMDGKFPPRQEDAIRVREVSEAVHAVTKIMAQTGICRWWRIWNIVLETVELTNAPRAQMLAKTVCREAGLISEIEQFVLLTHEGIVLSGCSKCKPSNLVDSRGLLDKGAVARQNHMSDVEALLAVAGGNALCDVAVMDAASFGDEFSFNGVEFCLRCAELENWKDTVRDYFRDGGVFPLLVVLYGSEEANQFKLRRHNVDGHLVVVVGEAALEHLLAENENALADCLRAIC